MYSEAQTLTDLGLTQMQARVYLALAKLGQSKTAIISRNSNVARPDVYRTISKLQNLGLVEKVIATPIQYKAIPIERGVSFLLEKKTKEYSSLKTRSKQLLASFRRKNKQAVMPEQDPQFILIPPKRAFITKMRNSIDRAQKSVDLVLSWKRFSQGIAGIFAENCEKAWARNVKFRLIVEYTAERKNNEKIIQFGRKTPACQLKFIQHHPETALSIYDEKELFVIVNPTMDLPESPALWTNNRSLISIAQNYFDLLWETSPEDPKHNIVESAV